MAKVTKQNQNPLKKQCVADSNFAQASYNNCTSKEFFSFRYTLVATNRNKVGLFGGVLSGIW